MQTKLLLLTLIAATPTLICSRSTYPTASAYALHTNINLYGCNPQIYQSQYVLASCASQLCQLIGVMPTQAPNYTYHQAGYGYSNGYSLIQQASNHTNIIIDVDELRGNVYITIFSSVRYDDNFLKNELQRYFQAYSAQSQALLRP